MSKVMRFYNPKTNQYEPINAGGVLDEDTKEILTGKDINKKADKRYVDNELDKKADKSYVNEKISNIDINQFEAIDKGGYSFNNLKKPGVYRLWNSSTSPCGTTTDYITIVFTYNDKITQVAHSSTTDSQRENRVYTRYYSGSRWTGWRELTSADIEKEIDNLKTSGVEINKTLVDALNSKGIWASTSGGIKTNANKVKDIRTQHNWYAKNLNPDPLFEEKRTGWEPNQNANISFSNNMAIINFRQTTSTPGIRRKNYDIRLISGRTYRISFYVKHTNKINNTRAYFFNKTGGNTIECGALNTYVQGNNFTRYTATFKPTKTDDYKLMILSSGPRNIGDIMYIKEIMISEGSIDDLFVPKMGDYSIGDIVKLENLGKEYNNIPFKIWEFTGHSFSVASVAVDNNGYVYSGSNDNKLMKISPSGNKVWEFRRHTNRVNGVAVDDEGYIYSAGNDHVVMKISPSGNKVWEFTGHTSRVNSVATNNQGYIFSGGDDDKVMKISPSGNKVWEFTGHRDWVESVAVDNQGYIYSGGHDNRVIKISPNGNEVWRFVGHRNWVYSVAVDNQGYVYSGSRDKKLMKISPNGSKIWEFTEHSHYVNAVAVDNDGYIYSGGADDKVMKISPNGSKIWEFAEHSDWVNTVAVDNDGYVYSGGDDDKVMKISLGKFLGYKIIA